VVEASAAKPALEAADRRDPAIELLVTDVIMPGMSGTELAATLKRRDPGLPVVYVSGYGAAHVEDRGIDTANGTLLEKPFGPGALLRTVRTALDAPRDLTPAVRAPAR
jgi:two-component system cell cycle sensor histidine kinase/response regulator CckA